MKRQLIVSYVGLHIYLMFALFLCSGCARLGDWAQEHFDQGDKRENPVEKVRSYIRSSQIYDQLDTVGLFDVLWLNDEVRSAYTDLYAAKTAQTQKQKDEFLQTELEENDRYISFYAICFIHDYKLGDRTGAWMVQLKVDDVLYQPVLIESVDLNAEYMMFLSKVWNRRKKVYLVKFLATCQDEPIITDATKEIELIFNTIDRSTSLIWDLHYVKFDAHRCMPGQTGS